MPSEYRGGGETGLINPSSYLVCDRGCDASLEGATPEKRALTPFIELGLPTARKATYLLCILFALNIC